MEERERAEPIFKMLTANDLSSHQPRMSPPTSTLKVDSKPDFASYRQSATIRPPNSAQCNAPAPNSRIPDSSHQVNSPDIQNSLSINQNSVAQNGSYLSQRPTASGLGLNSDSTGGAEVPRKYRLNKLSFSRDSHLWQTQDEPSLNQILEQERNAWLAQSPTDLDSRSQTPNSPSNRSQPSTHTTRSHQVCHSNQLSPAGSPPKRKSCFQEGSMNEGSRAVASTWNTSHPVHTPGHRRRYRSIDLSDDEGTPRASAASRASTSSSIDISEFKPLPATPSTFRNTIKRIGQKVVNSKPAHASEHITAAPQSEKKPRRGLKKSMSTWKIFSNSASDTEDASNLTTDDESYSSKTKTYSSKTIKPKRSLTNNAPSQKEILDERKRKAEIAYSEQFGTTRKKQKQTSTHSDYDDRLSEWDEASDSAATTGKGLRTLSSLRTVRSVLRRPAAISEVHPNQGSCAIDSSAIPAPDSRPKFQRHNRSQSRDSNQGLESDADHLKKQSRTELEKENQRLRMMLRGKEDKKLLRRSEHLSRESSDVESSFDTTSYGKTATDNSEKPGDKKIDAAASTEIKKSNQTDFNKSLNVSVANSHELASASKSPPDFILPDNAPPVPPLPENLQQHKALLPISGNTRPSGETATIKWRGPMCQQYYQTVLPRPLSMVLEGIEYASDDEPTSVKQNALLDGVVDDENVVGKTSTGQVKSSHDLSTNDQRWDWPEDVF